MQLLANGKLRSAALALLLIAGCSRPPPPAKAPDGAKPAAAAPEAQLTCTGSQPFVPIGDETWRAASTTATAITGDIIFGAGRLLFTESGATLPLSNKGARFVPDIMRVVSDADCAELYHIEAVATPMLRDDNTLCGPQEPKYIVAYTTSDGLLGMMLYAGEEDPIDSPQPGATFCGVLTYSK